jgi:DNA-binding winged helix-turn-helix (wHTH) protein
LRKIIKLVGKLADRQVRTTCGAGINIDNSIQLYRKKEKERDRHGNKGRHMHRG